MVTVEEALAIVRSACTVRPAESASLSDGLGRVLVSNLRTDVDWPPFDTSAMDGYAVRVADAAEGRSLSERAGLVAAGDLPATPLAAGEAVRVMTGAPLPPGTEAVVPIENVRRQNGTVAALSAPQPGEHLRRRGESIRAGSILVARGFRLGPADIALAALAGADPLAVHARPRITIAATGSELVAASSKPGTGQLRDSNGPMLAALCRARGARPASHASVADEDGAVRGLFAAAARDEDLLVTSGGVSAGDFDLLPGQAERAGFELLFHGVAMRPGKPVVFGRRGRTLWLGLPGNPVSSAVCFRLFGVMALDALEGVERPGPAFVSAVLARGVSVR
ncbi:MAG TPA: molybdopterin molybdotransferase MoeA, partial [Thermoanaerobaculia bacterium]|nr:molybdopterin molybdotransferase MoeA [Thermoanaerobaculia bacterium]